MGLNLPLVVTYPTVPIDSGNGDPPYVAFQKVNAAIEALNGFTAGSPTYGVQVTAALSTGANDLGTTPPGGYTPGQTNLIILSTPSGGATLNGLLAPTGANANGFAVLVYNAGPGTVTIAHQAASVQANQFNCPGGVNVPLAQFASVVCVYITGTGWVLSEVSVASTTPTGGSVYFPAMNTTAINAAIATASLATGGTVILQAGTYTMTGPIVPAPNVTLQGAGGWEPYYSPPNVPQGPGGTVLVGNGTFIGISWNATDQTTMPTTSTPGFIAGMLPGFNILNLSLTNFSYGIKIGALYNGGGFGCSLINVNCYSCTAWGAWLENFWHCIDYPKNVYCQSNTLGQCFLGTSGGTANDNGNSNGSRLFCETYTTNIATRGLVIAARGVNGAMDDYVIDHIISVIEGPRGFTTSTAGMTSGSNQIAVSNSAAFPPDAPVRFTGTATNSGFTTTQAYFVVNSGGNVITVSNLIGGTPIAATGAVSGLNITCYGFPSMEVIGYYNQGGTPMSPFTSGAQGEMGGMDFRCLDIESVSSFPCNLLTQSLRTVYFECTLFTPGAQLASVIQRASYCEYYAPGSDTALTWDIDNLFGQPLISGGRAMTGGAGAYNMSGCGFAILNENISTDLRQQKGTGMVFVSGIGRPEIQFNQHSFAVEMANWPWAIPSTSIGAGVTIPNTVNTTSSIVYTGTTGGQQIFLPGIPTNGEGEFYYVCNPSTFAVTLNSGGGTGQNLVYNGTTATSISLPAQTMVICIAMYNSVTSTYFWAVK